MEKLINGMMKARNLTLSEMTALLGYQSKTSLVRIMKNKANQRAIDTFVNKINENLTLTTLEQKQLTEALEYARWQEDYLSSCEMLKFLRGEIVKDEPLQLEDVDTGAMFPFSERYERAENIRITLINGQYVSIYQKLLHLVRNKGAEMEHFLQMNEGSAAVIHAIHMLVPLIFQSGYTGYTYVGDAAQGIQGTRASDSMVVQYRREDGIPSADLIVFDRKGHAFMKTDGEGNGFVRLLGIDRTEYVPVKHVYFESSQAQDYIDFCRSYAGLEYNRSIFKIKPDLCMGWIPEDILVDALEKERLGDAESIDGLIEVFRGIYHDRVRNVYEKRRVSRTILKRSAMIRFARTGSMTDHFWAMRPFTGEERVQILKLIRDQVENNPYFNVYFLRDNDFLRDAEIVYFEDEGIAITDANTDYTFGGKHAEVMIVHKEFMRMFREYFERCLIAEHVMNGYETLSFFDELIRIAAGEQ
ncbi:MAG: hypothetical protein IJO98_06450 [Clostridia bacterium]|nr:hypothetical protein [Clostridia bacterium]